ncbi:hypothetical protein SUGI_0781890 [Cryptomeria japonica]|uniref:uncharacterized protein LOC131038612 n=1 Tax=Cryptomeria japonica TaxID=3369 RepID=UPI002414A0DD|nr:uncharacterized protein LOC131038612 [Cryptomeria japonica]GLJ38400.1 hypothetical protein SUGI_0781890 [Cryptomeria japonica]
MLKTLKGDDRTENYQSTETFSPPASIGSSQPGNHLHSEETQRRGQSINGGIPPHYKIPAEEDLHSGSEPWRSADDAPRNETLGVYLLNLAGRAITRASHSVLRFDIRGPIFLKGPTWGVKQKELENQFVTSSGAHGNSRKTVRAEPETAKPSSKWVQGIHDVGARIKFMQIWDFPHEETGEPSLPWGLNIGLGASVEIDRGGRVIPKARLQTKHAVLHILPSPCFELRSKLPLGSTSFLVDIRYRISLRDLEDAWKSPGQLMVNFYSQLGTGYHIIPGALEFDEHVMKIGKYTTVRLAALLQFPKRIPLEDGDEMFGINLRRLEVKTRPT